MAVRRFSVEAIFRAIDRVTAPVTRMQNRIGKMTRRIGTNLDKLNRKMNRLGGRMKRVGVAVGVAGAVATAAFADVAKTGAQFEHSLITAAAKFPGVVERGTKGFQRLEDSARKAGRTTEFTASQAAAALKSEAQVGFDLEQSIAALPKVIDLATVAELDLASATNIAVKSLGAFNLRTKDSVQLAVNLTRVTDVLSTVANSSGTDVAEFFEVISDGATVLEQIGGSVETFGAMTGTLANSAIGAGRAGTSLKNILLSLSAATPQSAKVMRRLGVAVKDSKGDMRDVIDIFEDLDTAMMQFGTGDRQSIIKKIFSRRAITGANVLLNTGADALRKYIKELEGADGMTARLALVIRGSLLNSFKKLMSVVESVKISIFDEMRDPLDEVIKSLTVWIRANEKLIATKVGGFLTNILKNYEAIIDRGKQLVTVAIWVMGVVTALKALALILTVVNLVASATWVGLIITGVVLLIAVLTALVIKFGGFKQIMSNVADFFIDVWMGVADFFTGLWDGATKAFIGWLDTVMAGVNAVKGVAGAVGGFFGDMFGDGDDGDVGATGGVQSQMVSPGSRVARSIIDNNMTTNSNLIIRDDTGRAEVTDGPLPPGVVLHPSGAF